MTIKIRNLELIPAYQVEEILDFYNTYRSENSEPLDQCINGGGFVIAIKGADPKYMPHNQCIKVLRWHKNVLVTYIDYAGFSEEEEELLYNAMIHVLGDNYVKRFNSYSSAVMSSPSFLEMMLDAEKKHRAIK